MAVNLQARLPLSPSGALRSLFAAARASDFWRHLSDKHRVSAAGGTRRHRTWLSTWLIFFVLVLAPTGGAGSEQLMIVTPSRTLFALPYWVAEKKGFFAQEGISAGLEIIANTEEIKHRLRAGTAHLSIDTPEGVILDALAGGPLRIVGGSARRPPLFLVARPEIRSVSDLRGATFGVLSTQEGSSKLIPKIAASAGLSPSDYKIVSVGGAPARMKLLQDRKIDAALQPIPLNYEAEALGFTNLGWAGDYEPDWQFTSINMNIEWASRERGKAVGLLRALLRAQQSIVAEPEEAARIAVTELRTQLPFALRALADSARLGILDPNLDWSEAGLERIYKNLQDDGRISLGEPFAIQRLVAPDYLSEAQDLRSKNSP